MYRQNQSLLDLFKPTLLGLGYELVGIDLNRSRQRALLRVYIDKAGGITVDDCALVSRHLAALLKVENPIRGHYVLEVSSPGLDRPIFTHTQFKQFLGKCIKLRLYRLLDNRRHYVGKLVKVAEEKLVICCDDKNIDIPFDLIDRARLVPEL